MVLLCAMACGRCLIIQHEKGVLWGFGGVSSGTEKVKGKWTTDKVRGFKQSTMGYLFILCLRECLCVIYIYIYSLLMVSENEEIR